MARTKVNGQTYLDVRGSAEVLKLSLHYVRILVRFGELPAIRLNNRYWILLSDVKAEQAKRLKPIPVTPASRPSRQKGGGE